MRNRSFFFAVYGPLIVLATYLFFTLFLFLLGPLKFNLHSNLKVILYSVTAYALFILGYYLASGKLRNELKELPVNNLSNFKYTTKIQAVLSSIFIIVIILILFDLARIFEGFDKPIYTLLLRPGEGYHHVKRVSARATQGVATDFYKNTQKLKNFSVFLTPLKKAFFILGLVFWRKLKVRSKALFVTATVLSLMQAVLFGTQILVGELVFSLIAYATYYLFISTSPLTINRSNASESVRLKWRKSKRKVMFSLVALIVFSFYIMYSFLSSRTGGISAERIIVSLGFTNNHKVTLREGWSFLESAPSGLQFIILMMTFYIVQGYYGLGLSFEIPFVWTYGLGFSRALNSYLHKYLGTIDVTNMTYPARVEEEYGYDMLSVWSSAFPWLASDLTFFGTLLVMFFLGVLPAYVWYQIVIKRNYIGFVFLGMLYTGVFMLIANNQLFHTLENLIATVFIALVFIISCFVNWTSTTCFKPRFVFLTGSLDYGGASKMLKKISNSISNLGYGVDIVVANKVQDSEGLNKDINIISNDATMNQLTRFFYYRKKVNEVSNAIYMPFITSSIITAYPWVKKYMNCGFDRGNVNRLPNKYRLMSKLIYPKYDYLCFQTEAARNACHRSNKIAKTFILNNPVDATNLEDYRKIRYRKDGEPITFVTMSRLSVEKNIDKIIRAFVGSRSYLNGNLLIYGDGELEKDLKDLADALDSEKRIKFMGLATAKLHELNQGDVFILASDNEGMPNALLEAMSIGLPSISTYCMPGDTNVLVKNKEHGLVINKNSESELKDAMDFLYDFPVDAKMYGLNSLYVLDQFSEEKFNAQVKLITDEMVENAKYVY